MTVASDFLVVSVVLPEQIQSIEHYYFPAYYHYATTVNHIQETSTFARLIVACTARDINFPLSFLFPA